MSIFNMIASGSGGGGFEYEEGTFTISSSSTYTKEITFANSHSTIPAFVVATSTGTAANRTTGFVVVVYGLLLGTGRGGSYYADMMAIPSSGAISGSNYSTSNISNILTPSSVKYINVTNALYVGTWKWKAIWM